MAGSDGRRLAQAALSAIRSVRGLLRQPRRNASSRGMFMTMTVPPHLHDSVPTSN